MGTREAEPPRSVQELEELLSYPGPAVGEVLAAVEGDIVLLGAGGKIGPTLARMARRALDDVGSDTRVVAVSRWSDSRSADVLRSCGVEVVSADLADPTAWGALPDAGAVFYLIGHKFGSSDNTHLTWWMNAVVPGFAASRYRGVPTVVYSSGNVYPFVPAHTGGCREDDPVGPVGPYAQTCLAREQAFAHAAAAWGTPVTQYRLNYAVELRYGVLADLAATILDGEPVDVTMGTFNVVWQRDSNEWTLRSLELAASPPTVLNATGPETASTRRVAQALGDAMGRKVRFSGEELPEALLNDASRCHGRYGYPRVGLEQAVRWVADWVGGGGELLGKPTKFQTRDGRF